MSDLPLDPATVRERLDMVSEQIGAAGGDPGSIELVAVTKGHPLSVVEVAVAAGCRALGENYAGELLDKSGQLDESAQSLLRWHFLGAPQRNKMGHLAPVVSLWQGIDRIAVIDRLARLRPGAAILIQINPTGDPNKAGCDRDQVDPLVERARGAGLDLKGLMCVGPAGDPEGTRSCFLELSRTADRLNLEVRSMGMSDDYETAVSCGSTMLRLGRVLFGPRPQR